MSDESMAKLERKLDTLIDILSHKESGCCDCHNCDTQTSFSMTAVRANESASQATTLLNQNFIASQQTSQQSMLREMFPNLTSRLGT